MIQHESRNGKTARRHQDIWPGHVHSTGKTGGAAIQIEHDRQARMSSSGADLTLINKYIPEWEKENERLEQINLS